MSKSAMGFWDRLQAQSTTKLKSSHLSMAELERRREIGERKARIKRSKKRRQREQKREHRGSSPIAIEAMALDSMYRELLFCPWPAVAPSTSPIDLKQPDEVYIYGLADPRDHVVRYVGKTSRPTWERLREHEFNPSNQSVCEWLKGLRTVGVAADVVVLEVCKRSHWQEREIYWIARMRKEHAILNVAKGGKFYGPLKGKPSARASQSFHRKVVARSGPVRHLSRDEIAELYCPRVGVSKCTTPRAQRLRFHPQILAPKCYP